MIVNTSGWRPGARVEAYYAAEQETSQARNAPPTLATHGYLSANTADARGATSLDIPPRTPVLLYGERLDARDPMWIQTMA